MYAQLEKKKEKKNKSNAVANSVGQKKGTGKQGFGFVNNRTDAIIQKQTKNKLYNQQKANPLSVLNPITNCNIVQCVIGDYKPGTLAYTTRAMKGLDLKQMSIIQQLHDDPNKNYTIDEARAIATGVNSTSNPYEWDVTGVGSFATTDTGVQDVLTHFGHPTQSVVKLYDDLASRVAFDVGKNRTGPLTQSTVNDLNQMFEASRPLHVGFNPFLNSAWQGHLDSYTGAKSGIPLYNINRTKYTSDFKAVPLGNLDLNSVLKDVSGRPFELHHLLFKHIYPDLANNPANLMLAERSEKESVFGQGQHELMHSVSSGKHSDKFKELLPQFTGAYEDWVKKYPPLAL